MKPSIEDPNQSLIEFLDRYCISDVSPGYAVMLKGPWGSGKTWFVNQYQDKLRDERKKSLYVSLFGVSRPSDITDQFFAQIHPLLGNAKFQKTWTLAKSLLKGTLKLDLDGDGNDDGALQIAIPDLENWASTEGAILIFDDLERCGMPMCDILGFINQFVEHDGYRVLVLANEEGKLLGRDSGFPTIKEKVIGRTFQIQPNASAALDYFLKEVTSRKSHSILNARRDEILSVFQRAQYENLRQLRQAIFDFSDIWDCIHTEGLDRKMEFVRRLLNDVVTLSIEHRAGALTASDIAELDVQDWSKFFYKEENDANENPLGPKELALKRHGLDQQPVLALAASAYAEFFGKGNLSAPVAKQCLANSNYLADESTASWRRLWYLRSLTDEEFQNFSADVYRRLLNMEYVSEGELLHVVSILLSLAAKGLIEETNEQMLAIAKRVVKESLAAKRIDLSLSRNRSDVDGWEMSAFCLGFTECKSKEFQEFISYYRQQQTVARTDMVRNRAIEWMPMLETSPEVWSKHLTRNADEESWFAEDPVFAFVSADDAAKVLERVPTPTLEIVQRSLKERYSYLSINTKWKLEELHFLQELHSKMAESADVNRGRVSLSTYALKTWFLPSIEMMVKELMKFQVQLNSQSTAGQ